MSSNPVAQAAQSPLTRHISRLQPPKSVAVGPDIAPQLMVFRPPVNSYVILNSKPKSIDTFFGGNMLTIPHCAEVRYRPNHLPASDFFIESALDADGEMIPGSILVRDLYVFDETISDDRLIFDAKTAVCHILGIVKTRDGRPSALSSSFAVRGLSLLPVEPPKSLWHRVAADGEHRAFIASVQDAYYTKEAHEARNAVLRSNGGNPMPGGPDILWADELIRQYHEMTKAEISLNVAPYKAEADLKLAEEEMEVSAIAETRAMEMAEKLAAKHGVDKKALFNQLLNDSKVRAWAQKEYHWRRRGNRDALPQSTDDKALLTADQVSEALADLDAESSGPAGASS